MVGSENRRSNHSNSTNFPAYSTAGRHLPDLLSLCLSLFVYLVVSICLSVSLSLSSSFSSFLFKVFSHKWYLTDHTIIKITAYIIRVALFLVISIQLLFYSAVLLPPFRTAKYCGVNALCVSVQSLGPLHKSSKGGLKTKSGLWLSWVHLSRNMN